MRSNLIHQDIGLWEIWVEYDQYSPDHFGTLYVMGEVLAEKRSPKPSITKSFLSGNTQHLILQIASPGIVKDGYIKELVYSEPITNLNKYSTVSVYLGTELIAHLKDIEVMI